MSNIAAKTIGWVFDWKEQPVESRSALKFLLLLTTALLTSLGMLGYFMPNIGLNELQQISWLTSGGGKQGHTAAVPLCCVVSPSLLRDPQCCSDTHITALPYSLLLYRNPSKSHTDCQISSQMPSSASPLASWPSS